MATDASPLDRLRVRYRPRVPELLRQGPEAVELVDGAATSAAGDTEGIRERFPKLFGAPALEMRAGQGEPVGAPLRVGVVLSGGQAPGGHNVIAGLFDALRKAHPSSTLLGFRGGPKGVMEGSYRELSDEDLESFRNTGGFDLIGSGRDKIESEEQLAASRKTCLELGLNGLVVIGGDDSNTNAAVLAEYFADRGESISVIGVPKTIDGDLKGGGIEASFGFDTATRVYASLIGNIARDAASAGKYWHFIRLMGRSASHVTLECALQTRPNVALVAEEIEQRAATLEQIVEDLAGQVARRAEAGRHHGICLVPEGLIEFVPEMRSLIAELNRILADDAGDPDGRESRVLSALGSESARVFRSLPDRIRTQLLIDRDSHGNVQVSMIETEQLLIEQVARRLESWRAEEKFRGSFKTQSHFFGYEGRCANPTNFDADYTYGLGRLAGLLVARGRTGYVCALGNLTAAPEAWSVRAVPLTSLMQIEERKGRPVPVIRKALVRLDAEPFRTFATLRDGWLVEDAYLYPGAVQYAGPSSVSRAPSCTLTLENDGSLEPPVWLSDEPEGP